MTERELATVQTQLKYIEHKLKSVQTSIQILIDEQNVVKQDLQQIRIRLATALSCAGLGAALLAWLSHTIPVWIH